MAHYTAAQEAAITHHGHDILVAASAGSGKTTVLVERILRQILQGGDICARLVVTFTDAAANEMKQRIKGALTDYLNQSEDETIKAHLRQQLLRLPQAQISTLHAFCSAIIHRFYYFKQLDPHYRLMTDETEQELLQEQVWESLRNEAYDEGNELYLKLADNFSSDRSDDEVYRTLLRLYRQTIAQPNGFQNLKKMGQQLQTTGDWKSLEDLPVWLPLIQRCQQEVAELDNFLQESFNIANSSMDLSADQDMITKTLTLFKQLAQTTCYNDWYLGLQQLHLRTHSRLKKDEPEETTLIRENWRNALSKVGSQVEKWQKDLFYLPASEMLKVEREAAQITASLAQVTVDFYHNYQQLKRRQHLLDFNDLEQLALALLDFEQNGGYPVRDYYRAKFQEIMVDEYQDVNPLQEHLLQSLQPDHQAYLFMVGDVKQSIYGFRQAEPGLFTHKYQQFKDGKTGERIILGDNFRSTATVNATVNLLFSQLMRPDMGEIDYQDGAKLITGRVDGHPKLDCSTELLLVTANPDSTTRSETISQTVAKVQELITNKYLIQEGDHQRPITYQDIAILVSSKGDNLDLANAFRQAQLPLQVADANNYFKTTELHIMLALLSVLDNPLQDIPLVAILKSPFGQCDEEELAQIRLADQQGSFYQAITAYLRKFPDTVLSQKLSVFQTNTQRWRTLSQTHSLSELILAIYQESGYQLYVAGMPNGKQRYLNLQALYERAVAFEKTNFKGLPAFVRYIKQMQKHDKDLAQAGVDTGQNAVQLMTIHKSKGLEFPVVILFGIEHRFNRQDIQYKAVSDSRSGIGINWLDIKQQVIFPTLEHEFVAQTIRQRLQAEELRKLYVALTRAKQKLILIGKADDETSLADYWDQFAQTPTLASSDLLDASNFQKLIMLALTHNPKVKISDPSDHQRTLMWSEDQVNQTLHIIQCSALKPADVTLSATIESVPQDEKFTASTLVNDIFAPYHNEEATRTTAFQSVTELKRYFEDPDLEQLNQTVVQRPVLSRYQALTWPKPRFLTTKKISPTALGTAIHLIFQRVPLTKQPTVTSLKEVAAELVKAELIDLRLLKEIDFTKLAIFYTTSLGKALWRDDNHVEREVPFTMIQPAARFFDLATTGTNQDLLIHGMIDGYYENNQELVLFDYKSDHGLQAPQRLEQKIATYTGQLRLYAEALSSIKGRPVTGAYLYFIELNREVAVTLPHY